MTNVYQLVSLIKLKCVHRTLRNPLQLEMCPQNPSKPWHFLRKPVQALKELIKGSNYYLKAEIVEMTLVISWFRFLRVESRISELRVIIPIAMTSNRKKGHSQLLNLIRISLLEIWDFTTSYRR